MTPRRDTGAGRQAFDELLHGRGQDGLLLVAVGDVALTVDPAGKAPPRDVATAVAPLREVLDAADLVLGNLECALPDGGGEVATVPRLVSSDAQVAALREAGFDIVTLANNHALDCLAGGLARTRAALGHSGVRHFGAGDDLAVAEAPLLVEAAGVRVAFLGAADRRSTAPDRFATGSGCGVAPLDVERLAAHVRTLAARVDHIVVALHWGDEYVRFPAPSLVAAARALAEAGASLVVGTHPHVVQGMELYRGVPIVYSLGNFMVGDFFYPDGRVILAASRPRAQRTSCVLAARLRRGAPARVARLAVVDSGAEVAPDASGWGDRRLAATDAALARGAGALAYKLEHARVHVLLPALRSLRWSKLRRLRPGRVVSALAGLKRSAGAG